MVVVLTIKEIRSVVVGLFDNLEGTHLYRLYICDTKFFSCAAYFNSAIA